MLHWFGRLIRTLRARLDKVLRVNTYRLVGDTLVKGRGTRRNSRIRLADVKSWQILPEMGFDVVMIELESCETYQWLDDYNDLIEVLRTCLPDAEQVDD